MKNLFEQFANGGDEVTSKGLIIDLRANLCGHTKITKGELSYTIGFNTYLCEMTIKNAITIEDFDIMESIDHNFSGVPVDSIHKLKDTLNNSGLSSIAKSLQVEWKDEKLAVAKEISKDKLFKRIYGKGAFIWEALTDDERSICKLEHTIENYETIGLNHWYIRDFVTEKPMQDNEGYDVVNENDEPIMVKVKPTLDELKQLLNEFKNK